jgi:GT2 family glycosyltransferase
MSSDLTVVICSHLYSRRQQLIGAVESAERQSTPPAAIVVVIDGDGDLGEFASQILGKRCTVIVRKSRGGLSAARNSGLEAVATTFVSFLDDDAVADTRWLEELRAHLGDEILGVGGRSLPAWEVPPRGFPKELLWVVGCSYQGLPSEVSTVRNVFGGCALYRTELFRQLGGFDIELGRQPSGAGGCEETEFCMRANQAYPSGRFLYVPSAIIYHAVPAARSTMRYVIRRSAGEGTSKARLRAQIHERKALAAESEYIWHTIVGGLGQRIRQAARGDVTAVIAATMIIVSVLTAALSYAVTSVNLQIRQLFRIGQLT